MREEELGAEVALTDEPKRSPPRCIQDPREQPPAVVCRQHDPAARCEHPSKLADAEARAEVVLQRVGLRLRRDTPAGLLTYAEQRALEIGITVAGGSDVILLD